MKEKIIVEMSPNTACTRTPKSIGASGGSLRVFKQFTWLEVDSGKMALSRLAHQRVPPKGAYASRSAAIHILVQLFDCFGGTTYLQATQTRSMTRR